MKITQLSIKNFKSVEELVIRDIEDGLQVGSESFVLSLAFCLNEDSLLSRFNVSQS